MRQNKYKEIHKPTVSVSVLFVVFSLLHLCLYFFDSKRQKFHFNLMSAKK
jgi:hypothetical protein